MPEKAYTKTYASSKFLNTSARASSARSGRNGSLQCSVSSTNKHLELDEEPQQNWTREIERKELPKGVKSEAALRNKEKQEGGVLGEFLKTVSNDAADLNPAPQPRCSSKAALEIRAKHLESEVAKAMDSRQACELPVQKPRCQGREAMRIRSLHLDSKINFEEMFTAEVPFSPKTKLGPGYECTRNFHKSIQSEAVSDVLSHDYERELTPRPPPRVNYGGIRNASKMQGNEMNSLLHGECEEAERPQPKLGSSSLARTVYEQHRGTGDSWMRGEHEGDEQPAQRVRYDGQRVADNGSGSAMRQTLHEANDLEPQPALRVPTQAARLNYEKAAGNAMKNDIFADYRTAPLDDKPAPKVRSSVADDVRNHGTKGTAHLLLNKYGNLIPDDKPNPSIHAGAHGIYKKSQGNAMRQAIHGSSKRRTRPQSANVDF